MQRLLLALVVSVLSFSASGFAAALTVEVCGITEQNDADADCPPTCVTCGCCVQAVEPAGTICQATFDAPVPDPVLPIVRPAQFEPLDVLHVPKA